MQTNAHTGTRIDDVASGIYRISTPLRIDAIPADSTSARISSWTMSR